MLCGGNEVFRCYQSRSAEKFVWDKIKKELLGKGSEIVLAGCGRTRIYDLSIPRIIDIIWEPIWRVGKQLTLNFITQGFFDGMTEEGDQQATINLVRSAWAGSAKYGAFGMVWRYCK